MRKNFVHAPGNETLQCKREAQQRKKEKSRRGVENGSGTLTQKRREQESERPTFQSLR